MSQAGPHHARSQSPKFGGWDSTVHENQSDDVWPKHSRIDLAVLYEAHEIICKVSGPLSRGFGPHSGTWGFGAGPAMRSIARSPSYRHTRDEWLRGQNWRFYAAAWSFVAEQKDSEAR